MASMSGPVTTGMGILSTRSRRAHFSSGIFKILAEPPLVDLAEHCPWELLENLETLWHFLDHEAGAATVLQHLLQRERLCASLHDHGGADALAQVRVGRPDDGHLEHRRQRVHDILDLFRTDVLALADDDVLDSSRHLQVLVGAKPTEITCLEISLLVKGGRR